mmetsp:Transcript_25471/g.63122  ORF Transcript_25471/g.63122 Transcript_25471/m.63122 type:complete len:425 (-) Transcript_25471:94-1368(-)
MRILACADQTGRTRVTSKVPPPLAARAALLDARLERGGGRRAELHALAGALAARARLRVDVRALAGAHGRLRRRQRVVGGVLVVEGRLRCDRERRRGRLGAELGRLAEQRLDRVADRRDVADQAEVVHVLRVVVVVAVLGLPIVRHAVRAVDAAADVALPAARRAHDRDVHRVRVPAVAAVVVAGAAPHLLARLGVGDLHRVVPVHAALGVAAHPPAVVVVAVQLEDLLDVRRRHVGHHVLRALPALVVGAVRAVGAAEVEVAVHVHDALHLLAHQVHLVAQQVLQVGRLADRRDRDRLVGGVLQRGLVDVERRLHVVAAVDRVREPALQVVDVVRVLPVVGVAAEAALERADRGAGAAVIGVDDIDAHDAGVAAGVAHHANNVDVAVVRQRVGDREGANVIDVETEVGVDDQLHRRSGAADRR